MDLKPKKRVGRRPKLVQPGVRARLMAAIRAGCSYKHAAMAAGIDEATFYRYLEKADDPKQNKCYREFRKDLDRAHAEGEAILAARIFRAAESDHKAALAILARRHPDRWALRNAIELTSGNGGPVEIVASATEELLERIALQAERLAAKGDSACSDSEGASKPIE